MSASPTLSERLRMNSDLLAAIIHRPGGAVSKRALAGLAEDMERQASEAEELEAMADGGPRP